MRSARFDCPSVRLELGQLLKQARPSGWLGLALAAALHFSLTTVKGITQQEKAVKPLTTQFVKRAPRLTKPLEMKKRPQPKRRTIRRKMVSIEARASGRQGLSGERPAHTIRGLARPTAHLTRKLAVEESAAEPHAMAQQILGVKEVKGSMDLSAEMLDINALDTGKYHAIIIQDPNDKRNIRGFFHLVRAYSVSAKPDRNWGQGGPYPWPKAIPNLVETINKYTNIRTDLGTSVTFDKRELLATPFVFVNCHWYFRLTPAEAQNLGRYFLVGGFLLADDSFRFKGGTSDLALRGMIIDGMREAGFEYKKDWDFERLPNSHAIYHCFFDFPDGPPVGHDGDIGDSYHPVYTYYPYLEGVHIGERLTAIMSNKEYGACWAGIGSGNRGCKDTLRQLQFGVNIVIFALTQEGSITYSVMDMVR